MHVEYDRRLLADGDVKAARRRRSRPYAVPVSRKNGITNVHSSLRRPSKWRLLLRWIEQMLVPGRDLKARSLATAIERPFNKQSPH